MTSRFLKVALLTAVSVPALSFASGAMAQQGGATPVPPVQVTPPPAAQPQVQPRPQPRPQAAQPAPRPRPQQAAPRPAPAPVAPQPVVEPGPQRAPNGRLPSTAAPVTSPVDSRSLLPADTQGFAGAATRVDAKQIAEQRPLNNHELLQRVPGVVVVSDDGLARHSGIGIRGSNFRRSRKVLVQEDGQAINYSTYIDPSTHYTPPTDRVENVEVIRGTVITHGPLNNHGVINFQNLSPFGKPETVIKGALSYTEGADEEVGNYRHVHTRKQSGNFGAVVSYTGSEAAGAWDNEQLRFNDVYMALGWKDNRQDLVLSGAYFRGRDTYDEDNFVGTRAQFFANGRNKDGARENTDLNSFNHDVFRMQLAHNYRLDIDTTLSTRIYGANVERNRFFRREDDNDNPFFRGRERDYEHIGADSRIELANRPFVVGMTQDIQAGVRFERHQLRDCSSLGPFGVQLDASNKGACNAVEGAGFPDNFPEDAETDDYRARSFAAFLQSAIHVNRSLTITPGVRFEHYDVKRTTAFRADPADLKTESQTFSEVLPGVALAYKFGQLTTLYGGYHRGFAPNVVRDATFPLTEEVGDNFQVGVRSKAFTGFTLDAAYFHSFIKDYQNRESFTGAAGDNVFGAFDEVEIKGFELSARFDSKAVIGGQWNLFAEAAYTYTDGTIEKGEDAVFEGFALENVAGKRLPFTIKHYANLTLGLAYRNIWDASVTATYRGDFFTNGRNDSDLTCIDENGDLDVGCGDQNGAGLDELVGGKVDDVWLLSARTNLKVTDQLTLFVAGTNLTDELYISELSDGAKPGQGRTILGGFTLKFD